MIFVFRHLLLRNHHLVTTILAQYVSLLAYQCLSYTVVIANGGELSKNFFQCEFYDHDIDKWWNRTVLEVFVLGLFTVFRHEHVLLSPFLHHLPQA